MVIGVLQVELSIDGAMSLKDKRAVVRSLKDRLHREHQVSVAEVATLDDPRVATLGITLASTGVPHTQRTLDGLLNKIRRGRGYCLTDHQLEILTGK